MQRSHHELDDLKRRVRIGPLLGGMAGLLLLVLALLAAGREGSLLPSTMVVLAFCVWGAALAAAVLLVRVRVLDEPELLGPAVGYGLMALLLLWAGHLLPGFTLSPGPHDTATAIELALLALATPAVLVLVQARWPRRRALWVAAVTVTGLGIVLTQATVVSSDPAHLPVFVVSCAVVLVASLAGAVVWLAGRGRAPGDAEGWVAVGLVLTGCTMVLAMVEMAAGRGASFTVLGLLVVLSILSGGLLSSFVSTLKHRMDLDERFTDRIVTGMLKGFESRPVDAAHIAEVEAVLAARTLTCVLQPIVRLRDERVMDVESLARFPTISPDQAFAAAASIGREVDLELLAAEAALLRLPDIGESVGLAVNIGPEALLDQRFHDLVAGAVAPERVVVELTEHRLILRLDDVKAALDRLRGLGARIAVDDVGAGFSGLQVLANLRPDFVKLDRSLIQGIEDDPLMQALVEGIMTYAHRTGALVIAEGIEDARTAALLHDMGVQHGQGWHFGRPAEPRQLVLSEGDALSVPPPVPGPVVAPLGEPSGGHGPR